ncbi:NAD(P)H-dependent oxidoreductase [Candidatus Gracilibacteria bacterium]|nr:NAD(P)H-dependent oxidoreductase [Candidatus Gracilibacteria bacterium]MCF7898690.1 NAD(P)H-dependent oxidoreductase [Candidatus Paceibacterota bacterium]
MNILIVTAHPSPLGDTHTIAKTYADAMLAKNNSVQIIDLYADEYKVEPLKFTNIREFVPSKVQLKFQEQITWANEIVVVHPIWWGVPPSIMKSWAELTFWPRVAYRYLPTGKVEKMLVGKTAKIFATCGGPSWYYYFIFMPLRSFWEICLFGFSGIDVTDVKICGNLDKWKDEKRANHLQNFLKKIKNS